MDKCFTGTATTIEGVGFAEIAQEAVARHKAAYGDNPIYQDMLDVGGDYAFRLRGEAHAWTPETISKLQHAVRGNLPAEFHAFTRTIKRPERTPADNSRHHGVHARVPDTDPAS